MINACHKVRRQQLLLICCILLSSWTTSAQYEKHLDSLELLASPVERARVFRGSAEDLHLSRAQYFSYLAEAEKVAKRLNDKFFSEQLQYIRYNLEYSDNLETVPRLAHMQERYEYYLKNHKKLYAAQNLHYIAQHHYRDHAYGLAYENYERAYKLFQEVGFENAPSAGKFLHDFALFHYFFKNYEGVIRLMNISLRLPPFNQNHHIQLYNNLGASYRELGQHDKAIHYFSETGRLAQVYGSDIWKGITYSNLGKTYFQKKAYRAALEEYLKAKLVFENHGFHTQKITTYLNLAETYLLLDAPREANTYLGMIEKNFQSPEATAFFGETQQLQEAKRHYFQVKTSYLTQVKQYDQALMFKDSLFLAKKNIDSVYNLTLLKVSADKLIIEEAERKLEKKEKEKSLILWLYALLIIGGISIILYLYRSKQRKKEQSKRLISVTKHSIQEKQKELHLAQLEIDKLIAKINEQNSLLAELEEDLKNVQTLESEEEKQLNQTLQVLRNTKILTPEDWLTFQENFDTIFPEFKTKIKQYVPAITPSELRYLMLSKLNFSHKEMAGALGVSDTAIRVTWNRVRKKAHGTLAETATDLLQKIEAQTATLQDPLRDRHLAEVE